jgi:retron-type reverse transcriptase
MTFDQITAHGQDRWLEELRQELLAGDYRPQPLLRVWIPKSNGGQRPLGILCIRDRVVEMAALLVLGPIFEADLLRNQYGFRGVGSILVRQCPTHSAAFLDEAIRHGVAS